MGTLLRPDKVYWNKLFSLCFIKRKKKYFLHVFFFFYYPFKQKLSILELENFNSNCINATTRWCAMASIHMRFSNNNNYSTSFFRPLFLSWQNVYILYKTERENCARKSIEFAQRGNRVVHLASIWSIKNGLPSSTVRSVEEYSFFRLCLWTRAPKKSLVYPRSPSKIIDLWKWWVCVCVLLWKLVFFLHTIVDGAFY